MVSNICKKASGFSAAHNWQPMSAKVGYLKCSNGCGSQKKMDQGQAVRFYGKHGGTILDELAGQPIKGSIRLMLNALRNRKKK